MTSTIARSAPEVPMPAGAAHVAAWQNDRPIPSRPFFGIPRSVRGRTIVVGTAGHQWADGSIDSNATIEIIGCLHGLDSDQARDLASALLQAAEERDGWVGC
jgi:hypothetical protein